MSKVNVYPAGFMLLGEIAGDGLVTYGVAATVNIAKGDAVEDNGAGYAQLGTDSLDTAFSGVAVADANNTSGAVNAINVQVIPPLPQYHFIVPVEHAALITQTAVGTIVDLNSEDGLDISDNSPTAFGFQIESIDVSTEAIAANSFGYAIGRFIAVT